jgi:hypothetical protein
MIETKFNKFNSKINTSGRTLISTDEAIETDTGVNSKKFDMQCGQEIVLSYYAKPKEKTEKPYQRRWPKALPLPKAPKKTTPDATCSVGEGMLVLVKLKELFPEPNPKPKAKKTKGKQGSASTSTVSKTVTKTTISASGTLGPFSEKIIAQAKLFMKRYNKDKEGSHPKAKAPKVATKDAKKPAPAIAKKKVAKAPAKAKLSKADQEKLKNKLLKEDENKKSRKECYHTIRNYLKDSFKYKYKGKKCVDIGQKLKRCFAYSL